MSETLNYHPEQMFPTIKVEYTDVEEIADLFRDEFEEFSGDASFVIAYGQWLQTTKPEGDPYLLEKDNGVFLSRKAQRLLIADSLANGAKLKPRSIVDSLSLEESQKSNYGADVLDELLKDNKFSNLYDLEVNMYRQLSQVEEVYLAYCMKHRLQPESIYGRDITDVSDARTLLVMTNLRLVRFFTLLCMDDVSNKEDLIQECNLVLFKKTQAFDYTYGVSFASYMSPWLRQKIKRKETNYLKFQPDLHDPEELETMADVVDSVPIDSLHHYVDSWITERVEPYNLKQATILRHLFGLTDYGDCSLGEVAELMQVSHQYVSQIRQTAMRVLQADRVMVEYVR